VRVFSTAWVIDSEDGPMTWPRSRWTGIPQYPEHRHFCPFFNSSHHSPIPTLENFLHTKLNTILLATFSVSITYNQPLFASGFNPKPPHIKQILL
jgi:hypothetical protein